ncbi:MAG: hypothetical protein JW914_06935 [Syntrophaceae bacterium]|nr:hypothetical protein [Syntrophaceae bacterium]
MSKITNIIFLPTISLVLLFGIDSSIGQTIPEEARRHMVRGEMAMEMAKSPDGYEAAIIEFKEAARFAPRWSQAYYKMGLAQEKAGKYGDAIISLKKYLQLAPKSPDAPKIKEKIYKLEYQAEKVIANEVALEIFSSLADANSWHLRSETPQDDFSRLRGMKISGRAGEKIIIAYSNGPNQTATIQATPNGKILKYETIYYLCSQTVQSDKCPIWNEFKLEVISKRQVKMFLRQVTPEIRPYIKAEVCNYSYVFEKK